VQSRISNGRLDSKILFRFAALISVH